MNYKIIFGGLIKDLSRPWFYSVLDNVNAKWWTEIGGNFGSIILALFLKIPIVIFVCFLVLIDVSESPTDEKKPIDIYAIGFEEMVDLDAKNIMNTR